MSIITTLSTESLKEEIFPKKKYQVELTILICFQSRSLSSKKAKKLYGFWQTGIHWDWKISNRRFLSHNFQQFCFISIWRH